VSNVILKSLCKLSKIILDIKAGCGILSMYLLKRVIIYLIIEGKSMTTFTVLKIKAPVGNYAGTPEAVFRKGLVPSSISKEHYHHLINRDFIRSEVSIWARQGLLDNGFWNLPYLPPAHLFYPFWLGRYTFAPVSFNAGELAQSSPGSPAAVQGAATNSISSLIHDAQESLDSMNSFCVCYKKIKLLEKNNVCFFDFGISEQDFDNLTISQLEQLIVNFKKQDLIISVNSPAAVQGAATFVVIHLKNENLFYRGGKGWVACINDATYTTFSDANAFVKRISKGVKNSDIANVEYVPVFPDNLGSPAAVQGAATDSQDLSDNEQLRHMYGCQYKYSYGSCGLLPMCTDCDLPVCTEQDLIIPVELPVVDEPLGQAQCWICPHCHDDEYHKSDDNGCEWQYKKDSIDAERYRWLRKRDINQISLGGIFAGLTPDNLVLNGSDLDKAIDKAMGLLS